MTTVAVSGGFDPLHRGHVRLIEAASRHGDQVIVLLHSDRWLTRKKGYCVMSYRERREILLALRHVDQVIRALDQPDGGCDRTLHRVTPDVFCNGGDRRQTPPAERRAVESYGGRVLHGVGGTRKVQSSSWLVEAAARRQRARRPPRAATDPGRVSKSFQNPPQRDEGTGEMKGTAIGLKKLVVAGGTHDVR